MWELGVHAGHFMSIGDIKTKPGFAAGFHVRRALDYIFSLRGEFLYGVMKGEQGGNTEVLNHSTNFIGATVQGIISLNSLSRSKSFRKVNPYAFGGAGINSFSVEYETVSKGDQKEDDLLGGSLDFGAGISFRFSKRFNLGIEHKAFIVLGKGADLIDGWDNRNYNRTSFRDVPNYTSIRLNFNIGNAEAQAEPLYWINPLDAMMADISELKARPKLDLTDTDKDGVIDMLDQELNTPTGAPVDTRGIALDSDRDGVKDYEDKEPYSPPGYAVNTDGISTRPATPSESRVNELIDAKLRDYFMSDKDNGLGSLAGWFLPMIHFDIDRARIRQADYGHMSSIAYVLKNNPRLRVVVTGHTDKTASAEYNTTLSYDRARAAIDFLVNIHGIDRQRLILNYGGEENTLVPSSGSNFMNRRVEFRIATDEKEMGPPGGRSSGKERFKGNKDAGY